jgi:NADPH2:quinone reductase
MRAFTLDSFDAEPALRDDLPEPQVGDDELLVRVHASSVNPADVFIASGAAKEMAEHRFPVVLGRDFAGVVEQVGSGVTRYRVADEVFGSPGSPRSPPWTRSPPLRARPCSSSERPAASAASSSSSPPPRART